jgi:transposase
MAKVRHESARITQAVRQEIQLSRESQRILAKRLGINPKTVAKWKARATPDDLPSGPRPVLHRKLSAEEEAIIVSFREYTLLPLDDCLYSLQARIPHLTRSSLHRCFQRHGISRLPRPDPAQGDAPGRDSVPLGSFHIDVAEVFAVGGALHLFVAVDQASKFVFVQLVRRAGRVEAGLFLSSLAAAIPFRIHTVLTLNAEPFAAGGRLTRFARLCRELGIEHRLTTIRNPWTSGRVERMGRMIQQAGDDRIGHKGDADLARYLRDFVRAYNHGRRLKTLQGLTPHDFICRKWQADAQSFLRDPNHEIMGPENPSS